MFKLSCIDCGTIFWSDEDSIPSNAKVGEYVPHQCPEGCRGYYARILEEDEEAVVEE